MITVRKEWQEIKEDEELLEWGKKWGPLLMETWNNPIYTSGHVEGKKEILEMLDQILNGEYPDKRMPPEVEAYADALTLLSNTPRVLSFVLKGSPEIVKNLDEDTLKQVAASEMAKKLAEHIIITKQEKDGETLFSFDLVMLE